MLPPLGAPGDATLALWGGRPVLRPRPGLAGAVEILGRRYPQYDLLLIAAGPIVLGLLWLLLMRTRWGRLLRAASENRSMLAALGVNQAWLFTSAFTLGAFLAGLGGALAAPRTPATLGWTWKSSPAPSWWWWWAAWVRSPAPSWPRC